MTRRLMIFIAFCIAGLVPAGAGAQTSPTSGADLLSEDLRGVSVSGGIALQPGR